MVWFKRVKEQPAAALSELSCRIDEHAVLTPFEAYGISICHPEDWRIFINPSKPFLSWDGYVKIDRSVSGDKRLEISLSVRWAQLNRQISIDEYVQEIERQYELKQKKNKSDRFAIEDISEAEGLPHKAYAIQSSIIANHSIYRVLKNSERFKSLEYVTYCPETDRVVLATLCAHSTVYEENLAFFHKVLSTLHCHRGREKQELPSCEGAA